MYLTPILILCPPLSQPAATAAGRPMASDVRHVRTGMRAGTPMEPSASVYIVLPVNKSSEIHRPTAGIHVSSQTRSEHSVLQILLAGDLHTGPAEVR